MTINETVDTALEQRNLRHYRSSAQPVVDALVTREQDLVDTVAQAAASKWGVNKDEVVAFLKENGFHVTPEPEPEPEVQIEGQAPGFQPGTDALVQDLIDRVVRLEGVARQYGALRD